MEEIEPVMHSFDVQVTEALQSLQARVDEPGKPFLNAAWASYQDLQKINADIVALSRQNSNLRSSALSLGQKRKTAAQWRHHSPCQGFPRLCRPTDCRHSNQAPMCRGVVCPACAACGV